MDHLYQTTHMDVVACASAVFDFISGTEGDSDEHLVRYAADGVAESIADAARQVSLDLYHVGECLSVEALAQHVELVAHA